MSDAARLEQRSDRNWFLTGDVTLETIPDLLKTCESPAGMVDLMEVKRIDSAAIALLLEWQRLARSRATEIRFRNVPHQVLAIAGVSGVQPLLALED